jgi:hypothetical protein
MEKTHRKAKNYRWANTISSVDLQDISLAKRRLRTPMRTYSATDVKRALSLNRKGADNNPSS